MREHRVLVTLGVWSAFASAQSAGSFTTLTATGKTSLTSNTAITSTKGNGTLIVGSSAFELDIGQNRIQAFGNSGASILGLNPFGGNIDVFGTVTGQTITLSKGGGLSGTSCVDINRDTRNAPCAGGEANLLVNGSAKITGKLFIGTSGWSMSAPDYVFGNDYKLMPLSTVESYINEHHHLPGIASAADMENSGKIDLVQMNVDLLKKVEELTLYLVDQNKKIEYLQKQVREKN